MKKTLALGINLSIARSMGQEIDGKGSSSNPPIPSHAAFKLCSAWVAFIGLGKVSVMKIMQFLGAAAILTMLGGAVASANTLPAQPSRQPVAAQPSDITMLPAPADDSRQGANVPAPPQVTQQPRKLPLANFGQWDEAASEN
jgi:hypothetical protein